MTASSAICRGGRCPTAPARRSARGRPPGSASRSSLRRARGPNAHGRQPLEAPAGAASAATPGPLVATPPTLHPWRRRGVVDHPASSEARALRSIRSVLAGGSPAATLRQRDRVLGPRPHPALWVRERGLTLGARDHARHRRRVVSVERDRGRFAKRARDEQRRCRRATTWHRHRSLGPAGTFRRRLARGAPQLHARDRDKERDAPEEVLGSLGS